MVPSQEVLRSDIADLKDQLAKRKGELLSLASQEQGFDWERLGDRLGILHDPQQRNGWQQVGYLGFSTKREAQQCSRTLKRQGLATTLEIRKARRLTTCKWEIKAVDITPQVMRGFANDTDPIA